MAIEQVKQGFDQGFDQGFEGSDEDRELTEKLSRNSLQSFVSLIEDSDSITVGWKIDGEQKSTHLDISITAVADTKLARQMAMMADAKSSFSGFLMPDAAATMLMSSRMAPQDIEQMTLMLQVVREKAMEELDGDNTLPNEDAKAAAKDVLGTLLDVLKATVENGKLDFGAVCMLQPGGVKFAAGGYVADGAAVDLAFRKMVDLAKDDPEFPGVKLDAAKHGDVTFHTMSVPVPEDEAEAKSILGDTLDMVVGAGAKSVYLAFGPDSLSLLKKVIDQSAANADQAVAPMKMSIAVGPIMEFASTLSDDPMTAMMAAAAKEAAGTDHVLVTAKSIERGVTYRLEVESGILEMIGKAVQAAQGAGDGGF